ncbi:MAG: NADH-quinone oxidoreductase subunit N [Armatimonadetes bacterium]|nr:NADH-quinone oxidoreductase subunit N [Armatimonadota bacterium]
MHPPVVDLSLIGVELFLAALGAVVLVLELAFPRSWRKEIAAVAGAGMLAAAAPAVATWNRGAAVEFSGAFLADNLAIVFKLVFLLAGALTVLLSIDYFGQLRRGFGEYFALLVFFVLGLCLMASAGDLIVLYIAFELSSIAGYLLASWMINNPKSTEAGLKYFIYGAASSALMLYGLSLLYGFTGTLKLAEIVRAMAVDGSIALALAAGLVVVGLGYKIAMSPFHWWAPDVYEGAPTPVTAFLSVAPKVAGFALFLRLLHLVASTSPQAWPGFIAVLSAITMFTGNVLAIRQANIKRMLAYSSIAHAGYMLIGVAVATADPMGIEAVAVYAAAYLFMNLGAFAVATLVESAAGSSLIACFEGLAQGHPMTAAAMLIFLLSLTGIPPTAGFVGKLILFGAAIKQPQFAWLAIVGIINSVISLYYYMNVVRLMYFGRATEALRLPASGPMVTAVWVTLVLTLLIGLAPQSILSVAEASSRILAGV